MFDRLEALVIAKLHHLLRLRVIGEALHPATCYHCGLSEVVVREAGELPAFLDCVTTCVQVEAVPGPKQA